MCAHLYNFRFIDVSPQEQEYLSVLTLQLFRLYLFIYFFIYPFVYLFIHKGVRPRGCGSVLELHDFDKNVICDEGCYSVGTLFHTFCSKGLYINIKYIS